MPEPMTINGFADICGQFNGDVDVNNGYGCNHPDQEDWEYAREKDGHSYDVNDRKVKLALLRKKFGSYQKILAADATGLAMEHLRTVQHDAAVLATIGVKKQGCCFAHSCPLASSMEPEDWIELGEDPDGYSDDWVMPHKEIQTN